MSASNANANLTKAELGVVGIEQVASGIGDEDESARSVTSVDSIVGLTPGDADFYTSFSEERRRRVVRKIDVRLVPMLTVLYLMSHIDRGNIGNAKIEGLTEDLGLTGVQYNIALAVFFIPYLLLAVPSNILLKKTKRPSIYIGCLILLWGITMTSMGLVRNFAGLAAVRFLLGGFEAGFFPGAVYLCSFWYMPDQIATRISVFYCASAMSGAFSGLLAAAITQMQGIGGLSGWRWIFLLEGLATVFLGLLCFMALIDSPALSTGWLDKEEIRFLELQTSIKQGGSTQPEGLSQWKQLVRFAKDWRMYSLSFLCLVNAATSYGTKFTLPTITKSMGFSNTQAQLLSAPPYVAGALAAVVSGYLSDRLRWRMPFVAVPCALVLVGYAIILSLDGALAAHIATAYAGIVIAVVGIYPIQPAAQAWNANNLAPAGRRAVGVGFVSTLGNLGSILGSFMYLDSEAPSYPTGFGLSLALGGAGLLLALLLEWGYERANGRKAGVTEDEVRARHTEAELLDMGDESPLFRYVL